jgi:polyphenol oxidase
MEPFKSGKHENIMRISDWEACWPELTAGFSTRRGGISRYEYESLNCGLHVGDNAKDVWMNRQKLAEAAGYPFSVWTCAEQVHGSNIRIVTEEEAGLGRTRQEDAIKETDGLLTDRPNIFLASFYADCVPLFFYAPGRRVIGVAHAGWRGTVERIGQKMVQRMIQNWGLAPADIYAAIGPSIGSCCYEVNDMVAGRVRDVLHAKAHLVLEHTKEDKYMLNLQETNRILLEEAGVLPSHIVVSHLCTSCRTDLFFSHRKEGGKTGRMTAFIALKEG